LPDSLQPEDAPIPIAIDDEDLLLLSRDRMLTKLIILEDPDDALDFTSRRDEPIRYDATFEDDMVVRAKRLGKILVSVHIGNRKVADDELVGMTARRSLLIGRNLSVVDAGGKAQRLRSEYIWAEDCPTGPIQLVAHHKKSPTTTCPSGDCNPADEESSEAADCPDSSADRPLSPPGVDPANLRNNDLTNNFEYLCDGGDRRPRVGWIKGGEVVNIDSEDTVAEYRDPVTGKHFAVSNRVCLFAPRYVEVRVVRHVDGYESALGFANMLADERPVSVEGLRGEVEKKSVEQPGLVRDLKTPKELVGTQWTGDLYEVRVLAGYEQGIGWAAVTGWFGPEELVGSTQPEILSRTQFAGTLTLDLKPQIVGMIAGTGEVVATWKTQEVRDIFIPDAKPNVLVIEKTADRNAAEIGDIVTFAIRYTNTGKLPITNIAIADSLTTRLEYIESSAESDRPAVFTAVGNDVASTMLRWEVTDPLPPGAVGHVRFQARIR
jgi:uncharacterized repeat protein (TIGR01451 family)